MKTFLRRLVWTLGVLALLVFLFHLVETFRGRRAWAQWKRSQEAAGMNYDPASYAPKAIPDAENFAAAPILAAAAQGEASPRTWVVGKVFDDPATAGDYRSGRAADRAAFATELKGRSLKNFLQPMDARLAQLAEAARRPGCRVQRDYGNTEEIPLALAMGMRPRLRLLRLRALARLQAGHPDAALEDVLTGLRVAQHLQQEPQFTSQLLRLANVGIMMQPVWEGLQSHAWDEGQLACLEAALEPIDLLASMKLAWRYERALGAAQLTQTAGNIGKIQDGFTSGKDLGPFGRWVQRLSIPAGWIFQNLVVIDRNFQEGADAPLDAAAHRVDPGAGNAALARINALPRRPYTFRRLSIRPAWPAPWSATAWRTRPTRSSSMP